MLQLQVLFVVKTVLSFLKLVTSFIKSEHYDTKIYKVIVIKLQFHYIQFVK